MTEVDFLPEWYRLRCRRQLRMQRQWIALGLIFLIMITWNSFAARSISMASAELSLGETQRIRAEHMSQDYKRLRDRLILMQKKLDIESLMEIRLDVATTISRLIHLIPEGAVVEKLRFKAKTISDTAEGSEPLPRKSDGRDFGQAPLFLDGDDVRFQMTLCVGMMHTEVIADFLSDLEQSPYFDQVHLRYVRSHDAGLDAEKDEFKADDRTRSKGKSQTSEASEFEIQCFVVPPERL